MEKCLRKSRESFKNGESIEKHLTTHRLSTLHDDLKRRAKKQLYFHEYVLIGCIETINICDVWKFPTKSKQICKMCFQNFILQSFYVLDIFVVKNLKSQVIYRND